MHYGSEFRSLKTEVLSQLVPVIAEEILDDLSIISQREPKGHMI